MILLQKEIGVLILLFLEHGLWLPEHVKFDFKEIGLNPTFSGTWSLTGRVYDTLQN